MRDGSRDIARQEAASICATVLEQTGEALLRQSFADFKLHFTVPTVVETFEGRRTLATEEELEEAFRGVCSFYHGLAVTDLVRHIVAAEFDGPETIRATHECRILSGAQLVQTPFAVYSKFVLHEGTWKVAESIYLIQGAPRYTRALSVGRLRADY